MTKIDIEMMLINMTEQHVLALSSTNIKKPDYSQLFFLKINDDRYLACDLIAGFVYGTILEENYMSLVKVTEMIFGYLEMGYEFDGIQAPEFPEEIK